VEALDQSSEQGRDTRRQLDVAPLAIGKAGVIRRVDDRRVWEQRAGRAEHRQAADTGIEEKEWGGGVHCQLS
jgi:hypothetical protein